MSTDIARLGFSVDTSDLTRASTELRGLAPAAAAAENAAEQLEMQFMQTGNAAASAAAGIAQQGNAAEAAAAGNGRAAAASGRAAAATTGQGTASNNAAAGARNQATATDQAAAASGRSADASNRNRAAIDAAGRSADKAAGSLARLGAAAGQNINNVQATPSNIAAQFQDIGVTAAAGMNPMLIALQQGTQLSAAFAGKGGLQAIAAALGQMFSPLSLVTIGLVGLVAAGLQMVDWVTVGKAALNGLADILEVATPYLAAFAAGVALLFSPAIISGIWSLASAFYGLAAGIYATIGLPILVIAGLVALVAVAIYFRDEITQIFGFDLVGAVQTGINVAIDLFVIGFGVILEVVQGSISFIIYLFMGVIGILGDVKDAFMWAFGADVDDNATTTVSSISDKVTYLANHSRQVANVILGAFVGAYDSIKTIWSRLPSVMGDIAVSTTNAVIGAIEAMINGAIARLGPLIGMAQSLGVPIRVPGARLGRIANPYAATANAARHDAVAAYRNAQGVDYVARLGNTDHIGNAVDGLNRFGHRMAGGLRGAANRLGADNADDATNAANGGHGRSGGKSEAEKFTDLIADADRQIASLRAVQAQIGLYGQALYTAQAQQQLLNKASEQGITLDNAQRATIAAKAAAIGELTAENARLTFLEQQRVSGDQRLAQLQQEAQYIGMNATAARQLRLENEAINDALRQHIVLTDADRAAIAGRAAAEAAQGAANDRATFMNDAQTTFAERITALNQETSYLTMNADEVRRARIENHLLAEARRKNIDLTPEDIASIQAIAAAQGQAEGQFERYRDAINSAKEVTRGFFRDIYDGVRQGKSLFESLTDAFGNAIDKIVDKLVNSALDQLISSIFGGGAGGGGGGFAGFLTSLFGGGGAGIFGSLFGGGGGSPYATQFAKGGAFTNSVVDSPTFFKFANGAALGQMGEAGPEAIMPLRRGPNGSLGVQMYGGSRSGGGAPSITVSVNNYHTLSGAISSDDIVKMNAASAENTRATLRREIPAILTQYQRDGTLAS